MIDEIRSEGTVAPMADEANLLIFLLDGSGSMTDRSTPDRRMKAEHLKEIVERLLYRLAGSSKAPAFRVSLIYFSEMPIVATDENGARFYPVTKALELLQNPLEAAPGNLTAIADAVAEAGDVTEEFAHHPDVPDDKHVTLFLFTDGQETVRTPQDVKTAIARYKSYIELSPTVATISFGTDADEELLKEIASEPNERQKRHLDYAGVLRYIPQNPYKLFIQGHVEGELTEEKVKAIRNFAEVLSETR